VTGGRIQNRFLTVGEEYVVLSIYSPDQTPTKLLVLDDRSQQPGWHPATEFDLTSNEVPTNWRVQVGVAGSAGYVKIAPGPWLAPGFLEDYWGDGVEAALEAQETFRQELEIILRESEPPAAGLSQELGDE
jgi:hypothetical protein